MTSTTPEAPAAAAPVPAAVAVRRQRGPGGRLTGTLTSQAVPLLFLVLCVFGIIVAKIQPGFLVSEMLIRVGRNSVLVLALIIPILAGLGLNFGIVVGA